MKPVRVVCWCDTMRRCHALAAPRSRPAASKRGFRPTARRGRLARHSIRPPTALPPKSRNGSAAETLAGRGRRCSHEFDAVPAPDLRYLCQVIGHVADLEVYLLEELRRMRWCSEDEDSRGRCGCAFERMNRVARHIAEISDSGLHDLAVDFEINLAFK